MKKFKPYYLLLAVALFFLTVSFLSSDNNSLSINIYDTYYLMAVVDFCTCISIFFIFLVLLYWLLSRLGILLFKILSMIHVFGTSILPFLILYVDYKESTPLIEPKYQLPIGCIGTDYGFYKFMIIIFFLMLQILFIINIFVSLFKKLSHSATQ